MHLPPKSKILGKRSKDAVFLPPNNKHKKIKTIASYASFTPLRFDLNSQGLVGVMKTYLLFKLNLN